MSEPPPNLPPHNPNLQPLIRGTTFPCSSSSMPREYRKGNWTLQETLILITAKKLDDERRLKTTTTSTTPHHVSPSPSTRNSGELRWKWVENYCWSHGCLRSQNQCNDKWDNLLRDYKKVRNYEANKSQQHSSNSNSNEFVEFPSYWSMEKHQRKERKLPSNMVLEVYQAVTQVLQRKSHTTPQHNVIHPPPLQPVPLLTSPPSQSLSQSIMVATQPPPPLSLPPPPPPPPSSLPPPPQAPDADSTTPAVSEGSESSGTEYNDSDDDNSESKRRKFEQKLGSSIMRSASELARAIGSCEEKKEKRHRDMIELQQQRIQMEETRNQMNQQGFTNLVTAVTNLTGSIQSLTHSMAKDSGGGDNNGDACSS